MIKFLTEYETCTKRSSLTPVLLVDEGSPPYRPEPTNKASGGNDLKDSNDDLIHDNIWVS